MAMRRFQMMLDEELDEELGRAAQERGASKAELLRECARELLVKRAPRGEDPLDHLAGMAGQDEAPDEHTGRVSARVTEVLYGAPPR